MGVSDKTQKYLDMLKQSFDKNKFYEFINDLLNLENEDLVRGAEKPATSEQYKNYIESSSLYAKYQDNKRRAIGVIIIKLKDNKTPANARTLQRNYIAHLLDGYDLDASITAIYSNTDNTWRLSFVKKEIAIEVGKLKTKLSPAKRYSYLFGEDEPNHTAQEQLVDFIENNTKKYSVDELEEKFSVEKVTKDFFEKYKENYLKLKEKLEENEEFLSEAQRCDFTSEEFTKKLMGQLVFLYFLQKKGWLGVKLVPNVLSLSEYNEIYNKQDALGRKILDKYYISYDYSKKIKNGLLEKYKENMQDIDILSTIFVGTKYDMPWGTGKKNFIRTIFDNCVNRNKNFFDDYLEPFFYDGLNHRRKNQYFSTFNCKVPFLNGGLFEPLDNYMWESSNFDLKNETFGEILDFFDRYNFTMNEEEPLEKDVAVDPEMLGKIFENLLDVKDRKSKGAFYTPREIVHYMCQESLANYLVNKVGVDYNEIKEFIQSGELIRDVDLKDATRTDYLVGDTVFKNIIKIDNALKNIKVADPSVGSGAFPLGMLNEIVKLRDILTSYMLIYNREGLFDRKYKEEEITNNNRTIYKIKWETIKNCIYAVDIENSAVDITKLRLWLSIVVDQEQKTEPEPLPNLDCKIMQGNSLVDEYNGIKLIEEKFINELKDRDNVKFNDGGRVKVKGKYVDIAENQIQFGDGQKKVQIDDLIRYKQELYGENDANRKKLIIEKIQDTRKELLRLNFSGTNKEKELFYIDKSHNKPYFSWLLEYIEVFIENEGFDIVIGNPPYVDYRKIDNITKKYLEGNSYSARISKMASLYVYFIEKGYKLCNSTGNLIYINPYQYLNADSGIGIRKFIFDNNIGIDKIIDVSNIKVFSTADTYTCINSFIKNRKDKIDVYRPENIYYLEKNSKIINYQDCLNEVDYRIILNDNKTVRKMDEIPTKLDDFCNIFCGSSASGLNKIIIDESAYKVLSEQEQKKYAPMLMTSDFTRISYEVKKYIPKEIYTEGLQQIFEKNENLFMGRMTKEIRAVIVDKGVYCGKVNCLTNIKMNKEILWAILNSDLITYYYKTKNESKHLSGGYFGMDIPSIKSIPIIKPNEEETQRLFNAIRECDYDLINNIIYNIYEINEEEINSIKEGK